MKSTVLLEEYNLKSFLSFYYKGIKMQDILGIYLTQVTIVKFKKVWVNPHGLDLV